ncbi:unnamed protein product [Phytophthora lilii]|uniref:Unnamed protein product n=1 Tax=Phytophthora lilii TaxID=2077276 RepID=A0A9W6WUP1_9STRA|nr:unnamed protein product [Phytophthora lilii]
MDSTPAPVCLSSLVISSSNLALNVQKSSPEVSAPLTSRPLGQCPQLPVDGLSAASCARGVSALDHKVPDDAVEDGVVVVAATRQLRDVPAGARRVLRVQLHGEVSLRPQSELAGES